MMKRTIGHSQFIFSSLEKSIGEIKQTLASRCALILDSYVFEAFGKKIEKIFQKAKIEYQFFCFPAGEQSKTRETKAELEDALLAAGFDINSTFIAIGGGVACDLVGFLASTYCRGVDLVFIPTNLLAMTDAAVGGKNGVNLDGKKNWIGTTYDPSLILIDTHFLKNLDKNKLIDGFVEVIKIALTMDAKFFKSLYENYHQLLQMQFPWIEEMILHAIELKVQAIPRQRDILNFGHTLGHAIEGLSSWKISHGSCVAKGILFAIELSKIKFGLSDTLKDQVFDFLEKLGFDLTLEFDFEKLYALMQRDKKAKEKIPQFVLLEKLGKASPTCISFSKEDLLDTYNHLQQQTLCSVSP